ncbi:MAG: MipA/OmpV family protein [Cohaesibacteraceae bacterium]|nr:MipA/OmpV family protein [Cohaesibacteraceae bacterium]MBL4876932.1 MipA/OmpV family protein [Cohaesibacteraceae bacterium]
MQTARIAIATGAVVLLTSFGISAQASEMGITVGLGVGAATDYEGSDDYKAVPIPYFSLEPAKNVDGSPSFWQRFSLSQDGLFFAPIIMDGFKAEIGAGYGGGRDDNDNAALNGLGDIDAGLILHGRASYKTPLGEAAMLTGEVQVSRDITGDRKGTTITPSLGVGFAIPQTAVMVSLTASATWADKNYQKNTFGISATQATNSAKGYSAYTAKAGFKDVGLSTAVKYQFTESFGIVGIASYTRLIGDAAKSPIVKQEGSPNQFFGGAALTYKF